MRQTREDLLREVYLCKAGIQELFRVSRGAAEKIYLKALEIDNKELDFRPWENRVRAKSALKVQHLTFAELERQIKGARDLG